MVCYYYDYVHNTVFNLVFLDVVWLAPRISFQYQQISFYSYFWSDLTIFLLIIDYCRLIYSVVNPQVWHRYLVLLNHPDGYRFPIQIKPESHLGKSDDSIITKSKEKKLLNKQRGMLDNSMSRIVNLDNSFQGRDRSTNPKQTTIGDFPYKDDKTKRLYARKHPSSLTFTKMQKGNEIYPIDYKKTYEEISLNRPILHIMTWTTRRDLLPFSSLLVKLLALNLWLRTPLYELIIATCQYSNLLGLLILFVYEISTFIAVIYAYLKYKYLKNIICLLMGSTEPIVHDHIHLHRSYHSYNCTFGKRTFIWTASIRHGSFDHWARLSVRTGAIDV